MESPAPPATPTEPAPAPPRPSWRDYFERGWHRLRVHRGEGAERSWIAVSRDIGRWALIALPIGLVAGLGAAAFYYLWYAATYVLLDGVVGMNYPLPGTPVAGIVVWSSSFPRILLLPLVLVGAGLVVGFVAERLAPEVAGDGADATIHAFHRGGGRVRLRVPLLTMLLSALTLGAGGSGGREGPAAQIGGGFGTWWSSILRLNPRESRIALCVGLGAGVGAIFRAPLGGAIYSAEIFYTQDFEPEVLFPSIVASVVSYSIFGLFYGFQTLFSLPPGGVSWNVFQLPLYALLGIVCAGLGVAFVRMYRRSQRYFGTRSWPLSLRVGVGMLIMSLGVLAAYFLLPYGHHFAALVALNVGYGFVQAAMLGQVGVATLAPLALAAIAVAVALRMVSTSLTVGSGGTAGVFGTSVVLGALIGTAIGGIFHSAAPGVVSAADISAFAVVGMMTYFGGISKAPLAVLVMVVEMTGGYLLLVPAMLSIFIAYVATGPYHIYAEQEPTRLDSPAHREEYAEYLRRTEAAH